MLYCIIAENVNPLLFGLFKLIFSVCLSVCLLRQHAIECIRILVCVSAMWLSFWIAAKSREKTRIKKRRCNMDEKGHVYVWQCDVLCEIRRDRDTPRLCVYVMWYDAPCAKCSRCVPYAISGMLHTWLSIGILDITIIAVIYPFIRQWIRLNKSNVDKLIQSCPFLYH